MVTRLARISSAYAVVGVVSSAGNLACQAAIVAPCDGCVLRHHVDKPFVFVGPEAAAGTRSCAN